MSRSITRFFGLPIILFVALAVSGCGGSASSVVTSSPPPPPPPADLHEWTWVGGSSTPNARGVYGTKGVAAKTNIPGARTELVTWVDGSDNFWLLGGYGYDSVGTLGWLNDLWKYNPSAATWTWVSGSNIANASTVYGTQGVPAATNVPGAELWDNAWVDKSGNFWLFGGSIPDPYGGDDPLNQLWEFNPTSGQWAWISGSTSTAAPIGQFGPLGVYGTQGVPAPGNTPGGLEESASWTDSDGKFWLFGGWGIDEAGRFGSLNELWLFNPLSKEWAWMGGTQLGSGYASPGVYGTKGVAAPGNVPPGRLSPMNWTDSSGNFWVFGGYDGGYFDDLWQFNPKTLEWAWMGGGTTANAVGVYGTQGVPSSANIPPSRYAASTWTDKSGNLWLLGGWGIQQNGVNYEYFDDLWEFNPTAGTWTWVGGSTTPVAAGVYGTQGVAAPANMPGSRYYAGQWTDSTGKLWLFGGFSVDTTASYNDYLNDLWSYQP